MRWDRVSFSAADWVREGLVFLTADAMVSFLFFRSWIAALILAAGFPYYIRERKKDIAFDNRRRMRGEFLTGIQLFSASLQAGYAAENALVQALAELEKIYEKESFIVSEFSGICARMQLNVPLERLFADMAARSGVDDISSFAEVFASARRSGGDLIAISRNTVSVIRLKEETRSTVETALSGRQMEQNMMSVIPLLILAYVGLTTDGLLTPMYRTVAGRIVMAAALAVYIAAFLWGKRIMMIEM